MSATSVELLGDEGSNLTIATPDGVIRARLHLPGLYNVYNALAAVAVCQRAGHPARASSAAASRPSPPPLVASNASRSKIASCSWRWSKIPSASPKCCAPSSRQPGRRTLLIAINDLFADGTDVSWLWDVEFERLQDRVNVAVCSGLRAEDMAVRLKYAGVEPERIRVESDLRRALELALAAAEPSRNRLRPADVYRHAGRARHPAPDRLRARLLGRLSAAVPALRLVHLYPDLMSVYGDRGNVLTLARRAAWRGSSSKCAS